MFKLDRFVTTNLLKNILTEIELCQEDLPKSPPSFDM